MRKLLTVLLCIVLFLSFSACAEMEIEYDETLADTLGVEGDFRMLEDYGIMFYVPVTMTESELDVMDKADGMLVRYTDASLTVEVSLLLASEPDGADVEEADIEAELLAAAGIEDPELMIVNGLPAVGYVVEENMERDVMFLIGEGYGLNFRFIAADGNQDEVIDMMINSIMSVA